MIQAGRPLRRYTPKIMRVAAMSAIVPVLLSAMAVLYPGCKPRDAGTARAHKGALQQYRLGASRYREGDHEAAIKIYEKALQIDPNLAAAHLDLGIIYDDYRGDKKKAIIHYKEYLRLEPQSEKAEMVARWIHSAEEEKSTETAAQGIAAQAPQGGAAESTGVQADVQQARQDIATLRTENDAYLKTIEALRDELSQTKRQVSALGAGAAKEPRETGAADVKAGEAKSALDSLASSLESEKVQIAERYRNNKGQFEKALEVLKGEVASLQAQKKASDEALKKSNERFEELRKVASEEKGTQPMDDSLRQKLAHAHEKIAEVQRENNLYLKDNKALISRLKKAEKDLEESSAKRSGGRAQPQVAADTAYLIAKAKADGEREKEELRQSYDKKLAELTSSSAREKAGLQKALAESQRAAAVTRQESEKDSSKAAGAAAARADSGKLVAGMKAEVEREKEELRLSYEKKMAELSGAQGREKAGVQRELADARREALYFKAQVEKEREKTGRADKLQSDAIMRLSEQHRREKAEMEQRFRREKESLLSKLPAAQGRSPEGTAAFPQPKLPVRETVQSAPQKGAGSRTLKPAAAAQVRRYQVARGDSLQSISLRFYGSADRWRTIYNANRGVLSNPAAPLRAGRILVIP